MDVDQIAEAIAGDATCAQGEFYQRKVSVVAHLIDTGHELAAALFEIERLRASQERLKSAIEFAHSEGFQWPSDPMAEFAIQQEQDKP